jgi:predicted ATPase
VPFVGRARQLEKLRSAFARTGEERACVLCTIVGPAGMGKSRLAEEFVGELDGSATVAVGRCLSYGEAITYHALAEILQELVGADPDARIAEAVGGEDADLVARRVRTTMGLSRDTAPAEETFWAVRRLFEAVAAERPLVAVLDDLHWGEPLLLDLLEYLAGFSTDAPILILCLAREDLFETRPSWAAGEVVTLDALAEPEARELVHAIGEGEVDPPEEARIVRTAEGNPLFLEQLVATRTDCGPEHMPPNVQALLTARVASLDPGERTVLEHASVEGRNFRWSVVAELLPEEARGSLGRDLMALVRRQLIEPDPSVFAGEDGFRFSHVLIREAVYEGLRRRPAPTSTSGSRAACATGGAARPRSSGTISSRRSGRGRSSAWTATGSGSWRATRRRASRRPPRRSCSAAIPTPPPTCSCARSRCCRRTRSLASPSCRGSVPRSSRPAASPRPTRS